MIGVSVSKPLINVVAPVSVCMCLTSFRKHLFIHVKSFSALIGRKLLCTSSSVSPAVSLCGWTEKNFCARFDSTTKSANNNFHIANASPHDDNHLPSINKTALFILLPVCNARYIICVPTRDHCNEFILREERWPISKVEN